MKKPFAWLSAWLVVVGMAAPSQAAEIEVEGTRLLVSGQLDGSAIQRFKDELARGQVRTVVFENSTGGTPEAAAEYVRAIRASGVNTEAKGQCQAACAYAFLAGKEHRFSRGLQVNGLLIPVVARPNPDELANRWRGDDAHRTLAEFTDETADAATAASTREASAVAAATTAGGPVVPPRDRWQPEHGVLFMSTPTLFGRVYASFYCDGSQGRDTSRCEFLSNADPYKIGVLTP